MKKEINFPIEINEFIFHENKFISNGRSYNYSEIESLRFSILQTSINFSKDESYILKIRKSDDTIFSISAGDATFSFNQKKAENKKQNILKIFNYLNEMTFEKRLNGYLNQIKENKFFIFKFPDVGLLKTNIKFIKVFENGDISANGKIFSTKKARLEGTLKFGTAYGLGCDRTIDPHEISINENRPILGGFAEGTGSLRIDGGWDYPIFFELLKIISQVDSSN